MHNYSFYGIVMSKDWQILQDVVRIMMKTSKLANLMWLLLNRGRQGLATMILLN